VKDSTKAVLKRFFTADWHFLPESVRRDDQWRSRFRRWLFWGILLRVVLIPIAAHNDLFAIYGRSAQAVAGNFNIAAMTFQYPVYIFHVLALKLFQPFIKTFLFTAGSVNITYESFGFWQTIVQHPDHFLFLVAGKLPYFAVDLICIVILLRLFDDHARRLSALKLWLFNPILIYVVYLFARFDMLALPFVLLSFLCCRKGRSNLAALAIGATILIRIYYVFLLPFYALLAVRGARRRLEVFALTLAPAAVSLAPLLVRRYGLFAVPLLLAACALVFIYWKLRTGAHEKLFWGALGVAALALLIVFPGVVSSALSVSGIGSVIREGTHVDYPFKIKFPVQFRDTIYLFVVLYGIYFYYLLGRSGEGLDYVADRCAVFMLGYFAIAHFHPQYVIALLPFVLVPMSRDARIKHLHYFQFSFFFLYVALWPAHVVQWLFAPLWPEVFNTPALFDSLKSTFGSHGVDLLVGSARSLFTATSLWMACLLLKKGSQDADATPSQTAP